MAKAVNQNELAKSLEFYIKIGKYSNFATVKKSPKDAVTYVDYLNTSYKKMGIMLDDLQDMYLVKGFGGKKIPQFSSTTTSIKVLIGEGTPRPVINFRSYKIGANAPTQVQEAGSSFILQQVLNNNKVFNSAADIENDEDTYTSLERLFANYESSLGKWLYTYYQQQKQFLAKYKSPAWKEFKYGDGSFVDLFDTYIKEEGLYSDFEKKIKIKKYTEWNPSDIYAVKNPKTVKTELDKIFKVKNKKNTGAHLGRLNAYLIRLIDKKELVGISLKQIKDKARAILEIRNTKTTFKDPHIEDENFSMSDIKFQIDNIFKDEVITTYIKFGTKFAINISGSTSKLGNLSYATQITGASAQGGNSPVAFVNNLMREENANQITYVNNNKQYPSNEMDFVSKTFTYQIKHYREWYKFVKKYFKNAHPTEDKFIAYISKLYQKNRAPIAQTKLMTLHFFYDTLRFHDNNKEFWLRMLYLGMKVGKRFAPHAKIYEEGKKD